MKLPVLNQQARQCGDCTLCCKVLEVRALKKPKDSWCPECGKKGGCKIYASRPEECQVFRCGWLDHSNIPDEWKPTKIHGVITATLNGEHMVIHEDPGYPGHASYALRNFIETFNEVEGGRLTFIVCGERRTILGSKTAIDKILRVEYDATTGATHVIYKEDYETQSADDSSRQ